MATMAEGASATCWPPGYAWPRILDLPPPPIRPRRRTGRNLARWSPGDGDGDGDGDGERLAVPSAAEHVRLAPLVTAERGRRFLVLRQRGTKATVTWGDGMAGETLQSPAQ